MRKASLLSLATFTILATAAAGPAAAQEGAGRAGGIGVGVTQMLQGPQGVSFTFDAGAWHADAILSAANEPTVFGLGARGWFHLHSSAAADFSVGGGLGFSHRENQGLGEDSQIIAIDLGMLLRAFIVSNVALSTFGGVSVVTGDQDRFVLNGNLLGGFGITYFFQ